VSGGSFDYLYMRPEAEPGEYEQAASALEVEGYSDAAAAVREVVRIKREGEHAARKLEAVLHALEWKYSGDWGPERLLEAVEKWRLSR
jgi:hypothetical protein